MEREKQKCIHFQVLLSYLTSCSTKNLRFRFRVCTVHPKLGVFSKLSKYSFFCCFITRLVKKLQQWSLYEVIEDILPFVLNTKWPLSDIWLLRYKQNKFGCFIRISEFHFFQKHPKLFCL